MVVIRSNKRNKETVNPFESRFEDGPKMDLKLEAFAVKDEILSSILRFFPLDPRRDDRNGSRSCSRF